MDCLLTIFRGPEYMLYWYFMALIKTIVSYEIL